VTSSRVWLNDIRFCYFDERQGLPFVFQHGLGADRRQVVELFRPREGVRLVGFDFRGHGESRPLGDPSKLRLDCLAADMLALMNHLGVDRAVVGGVSLGAAVALRFALDHPNRTLGLIVCRPAWLADPRPDNVDLYARIASLIRQHGAMEALRLFSTQQLFESLAAEYPATAESIAAQFRSPRAEDAVARLESLASDRLCGSLDELGAIHKPCLVLSSRGDPIHPFEYGQQIASAMPDAKLVEITSKSVSRQMHAMEVDRLISDFLASRFRVRAARADMGDQKAC
jgi:pimeloyl-ACP methyl ester carboxylesterase